jgi:hypothetical protein
MCAFGVPLFPAGGVRHLRTQVSRGGTDDRGPAVVHQNVRVGRVVAKAKPAITSLRMVWAPKI